MPNGQRGWEGTGLRLQGQVGKVSRQGAGWGWGVARELRERGDNRERQEGLGHQGRAGGGRRGVSSEAAWGGCREMRDCASV